MGLRVKSCHLWYPVSVRKLFSFFVLVWSRYLPALAEPAYSSLHKQILNSDLEIDYPRCPIVLTILHLPKLSMAPHNKINCWGISIAFLRKAFTDPTTYFFGFWCPLCCTNCFVDLVGFETSRHLTTRKQILNFSTNLIACRQLLQSRIHQLRLIVLFLIKVNTTRTWNFRTL